MLHQASCLKKPQHHEPTCTIMLTSHLLCHLKHTHTHTQTHTHTHSLSLSFSHTHKHTHTPSLSLSLSHTHTHTLSLSLSLSFSLSLSLSLTHTHVSRRTYHDGKPCRQVHLCLCQLGPASQRCPLTRRLLCSTQTLHQTRCQPPDEIATSVLQ